MAHQKKILISLLILILIISLTLFLSVSCAGAKGVPKEITNMQKTGRLPIRITAIPDPVLIPK